MSDTLPKLYVLSDEIIDFLLILKVHLLNLLIKLFFKGQKLHFLKINKKVINQHMGYLSTVHCSIIDCILKIHKIERLN